MEMTEQKLREDLTHIHHIIKKYNWDDLLATHQSVRLPNHEHILITGIDIPFDKVTSSNLVKCDLDGRVVGNMEQKIMPQARNIHCAIYSRMPEVNCIIHTHSQNAVAVSCLKEGFAFTNQQSLRFYDEITYCDYTGLALEDEGEHIANALGDKSICILRNHGILIASKNHYLALYYLYYLEKCFDLQLKIMSVATLDGLVEIPEAIKLKTKGQFNSIITPEVEFKVLCEALNS
jgi:ribulose-5-phosphate 4-epimerase/fuculose-1-phosphate aldolase